jgi:alpha-galactosidase
MYRVSTSHPVQALLDEQNTTLAAALPTSLGTGSTTHVTVTLTNNGVLPVTHGQFALDVPSGWTAKRTGTAGPLLLNTGQTSSASYDVKAPATAPPVSAAALSASAKLITIKGATTDTIALSSTLVSPIPSSDRTANTTGADAIFGGSGSDLAIVAAGAGVAPASTSTRGTTPATDSYAAIYLPGAATSSSTAQVTVTAEAATARGAKAGLMMRNDATSPSGSPEGVVLYVTGSKTVAMSWNASGGATVDTSSTATAAQALPVQLRLVRSGSTYTGYYSTDGSTWTTVATATVADAAAAPAQDAGVFQTSGSATAPAEADFSGLSIE